MLDKKFQMLIEDMPLSDSTIPDIRIPRAIDKERIKCHSFMPHKLYVQTLERRSYYRIFENSFSEPMTHYDADYGRAFLVSKKKNKLK